MSQAYEDKNHLESLLLLKTKTSKIEKKLPGNKEVCFSCAKIFQNVLQKSKHYF